MSAEMFQEYINQGNVIMETGDAETALKYFEKAEKADPNRVEVYLSKGMAYANLDRFGEAEKTFKKALLVNKKCGEAYFHMGCMAGLRGDLNQGIKYLDTALVNGFDGVQTCLTLGMMYEEQGNENMALRNYNKVLLLEPTNIDAHIQKCNLLIQSNRKKESIEALNTMIQNCPDYFEGYHLKCRVLAELGEYDKAIEVLNQGLEMFPEEMGFEVDKAKLLVTQNRLEEAQKILEELAKRENEEWKRDILLEMVRIAGIQENIEKTEQLLVKAFKECRTDGQVDEEISYLLMSVYMTGKKYDLVLSIAKQLMEISNNTMYTNIAHFYYAESLRLTDKEEEAKAAYEETIKKCRAVVLADPTAVDSYMLRALSLHRIGKHEDALEMIDYIIAVAPESPEVHTAKAVILKELGRTEEMHKEVQLVNEIGGKLGEIASTL